MKITYKIKLHPLFYVVVIIFFLTGHFHDFFLFLSIIIFHELGHIIGGLLFKWKIKELLILPFGALTIFDEGLNKPLKQELIITILGPLFQIIYYLMFSNKIDIMYFHYSLLIFNLLPITPLDGSKIINVFFNKIFPFKKSYFLTLIVSSLLLMLLFLINCWQFNFLIILIIFFLVVKVYQEAMNLKYIFERFLYERYCYNINCQKLKKINKLNLIKMYKDYRHLFYDKGKYYTEREILRKRFDFKSKL